MLPKTTNTKIKTDLDTKITVRGNVFVDRRPLLNQGFKPSEIVDDWMTVFNPFGILNSSDSTIIVDLNHNSSSTGAEFLKYESVIDNVHINNVSYSLPVLRAEVLFRKGNTGKVGTREVDVFDMVKNAKSTGWSATTKIRSFTFYDENWKDVTQEVKEFVKPEVWSVAPNLVKRISKEMGKDVYCSIDSYYLIALSILTDVAQGHFDAGFKTIKAERGFDKSEEIIVHRYINNIMSEDTEINKDVATANEATQETRQEESSMPTTQDVLNAVEELKLVISNFIEEFKTSDIEELPTKEDIQEVEDIASEATRNKEGLEQDEEDEVKEIENITAEAIRNEDESENLSFDPKSENQATALVNAERGVQKTNSNSYVGITPHQRTILQESLYKNFN